MRPQEMGQREASGRRQREVHPQQLEGGSELGAAMSCRSAAQGTLPFPAAMSTLCQCLQSGNKSSEMLGPAKLIFVLVKGTVNKGELVSPCMWSPEL